MVHKHDGGRDALQRFDWVMKKLEIISENASWTRPNGNLLYASLMGESCTDPTSCLIKDPIPEDSQGRPIYADAWRYMCLPPTN